MKRRDRLKPAAEKILGLIASGSIGDIYSSTATFQEIIFWFFNRGMLSEMVQAVNALSHVRGIRWIDISPAICLTATLLMREHDINPFDAYHAATAIREDKIILGTEHVYDRIDGIERIDPVSFADQI